MKGLRTLLRGLMGQPSTGEVTGQAERRTAPRTPRSRVRLPAVSYLPGDVLRVIREFNPNLDAYVHADGRVWLLKHEEDKARIHEGRRALFMAKQEGDYGDLESAHLMADGWSLLGELPFHEGMSASALLRHAQMTLYATPQQIEADHKRRREIADGTDMINKARAMITERVKANATFDHSFAFKGRKSFGYQHAKFNPFGANTRATGPSTFQRG